MTSQIHKTADELLTEMDQVLDPLTKDLIRNQLDYMEDCHQLNTPDRAFTSVTMVEFFVRLIIHTTDRTVSWNEFFTPRVMLNPVEHYYKPHKGFGLTDYDRERIVVEAGSTKTSVEATFEFLLDAHNDVPGGSSSIKADITSRQLSNELDSWCTRDIYKLAHDAGTMPSHMLEYALIDQLRAYDIANNHAPEYIICPRHLLSELGFKCPAADNTLVELGRYRGMKLFCYNADVNSLIIGRKTAQFESYTVCPRILLMTGGMLTNPITFQPLMKFMFNHGKYATTEHASNYHKITVE